MTDDYEPFVAFAAPLALAAGRMSSAQFGRVGTSRKADDSVVTEIDHRMQAIIVDAVSRAYPDHAIIAEESHDSTNDPANRRAATYCWVIDPLDGTRNYALGFPCFATSIAVLERGVPVAAVVVEHMTRSVYSATRGNGSRRNDEPIRVARTAGEKEILVGIPSSKDALSIQVGSRWLKAKGLICRNLGSAAMHLSLVASGAFAGAFCKRCKLWDVAAGVLLVKEAGGQVTDAKGREVIPFRLDGNLHDDLPVLAAADDAHQRLLRFLHPPARNSPRA